MQFEIEKDEYVGSGWKWFTFERGGESVKLELLLPTAQAWQGFVSKFQLGQRDSRPEAASKYMARHFFRDFKDAKGKDGKSLKNDEKTRYALLQWRPLWDFVFTTISQAADEEGEGNAGSGSA